MKAIIDKCRNWWNEHYQGFSISLQPGINFGKTKEKHTIEHFESLLESSTWQKEYIAHEENWVAERNNTFQIQCGEPGVDFHEPWTKMYPDQNPTRYPVYLKINNTIIKELTFILLDGGRIFVPITERESRNGITVFYWDMKSLPVKVCKIIGQYYNYNDLHGVAKMSKVEIRNDN